MGIPAHPCLQTRKIALFNSSISAKAEQCDSSYIYIVFMRYIYFFNFPNSSIHGN